MPYLGNTPTTQSFISGTDYFNGTGAQTAFTLSRTVASVNDIQAVVNNVVQVPNDAYTISGTTITFTSAPSAGTQNVYVRYLSTTTQAITPSQNTVSWNTLDSNIQQDLGVMFKNRIINGNMVIDQRNAGASVNISNNTMTYTADRWAIFENGSMAFSAQQSTTAPTGFINSLLVTTTTSASAGSTDRSQLEQRIEGLNISDLGWGTANAKTITLSFWIRSSLTGQFGGAIQNYNGSRAYPFSFTINSANTFEYKTITIVGDTSGTWLTTNGIGLAVIFDLGMGSSLLGTAGAWSSSDFRGATGDTKLSGTLNATLYLTGVQLEVGTQATAFSTAGGSYGAELALCQRYYWKTTGTSGNGYAAVGAGGFLSTTSFSAFIPYPVQMRATPTFSIGTSLFIPTSGFPNISSISANYSNQYSGRIEFTTTTSTAGFGGSVGLNNATTSFIDASAEL